MLKNNGKMIIGRNFLFCLCVICLMFTAFGLFVEDSFALDLNETVDEIELESNDINELENSQENNVLEANSQDQSEVLGQQRTPDGNTYASIQDTINAAKPGDTILLKDYYYSKGNPITINKPVTITSNSMATLDGKHLSQAIIINDGGAGTVFKNIKFINGEGKIGSGIIVNAKNVRIENCIFEEEYCISSKL